MLEQIQVNGGMSPGNSGGPVITVRKAARIPGVARGLAGIKGTQINFAIPGDFVKRLMDGGPRRRGHHGDEAFLQNGQTMLPVKVTAIDPLNKIQSMRIEVWTGNPGQPRPLSNLPPQPLAGDSPHQPQQLVYRTGSGSADITRAADRAAGAGLLAAAGDHERRRQDAMGRRRYRLGFLVFVVVAA